MTRGEYRVGINFNPSQDDVVGQLKRHGAALIDLIESIGPQVREDAGLAAEVLRLKGLAQTAIEEGTMWAVKAATKPVREA